MSAHETAAERSRENKYPNGPRVSPDFAIALAAYRRREREIEGEFAADLAKDYNLRRYPAAAKKAFDYAWQEGHSEGYRRVEEVYEEIAEIVLVAAREGRG